MPVLIPISKHDYEDLKALQKRSHWLWPAKFSANENGSIWPWITNGWTPFESRDEARGLCPVVDRIADEYLLIRPGGGRFFINECGAFYKDESCELFQFVTFDFSGGDSTARMPRKLSREELLKQLDEIIADL